MHHAERGRGAKQACALAVRDRQRDRVTARRNTEQGVGAARLDRGRDAIAVILQRVGRQDDLHRAPTDAEVGRADDRAAYHAAVKHQVRAGRAGIRSEAGHCRLRRDARHRVARTREAIQAARFFGRVDLHIVADWQRDRFLVGDAPGQAKGPACCAEQGGRFGAGPAFGIVAVDPGTAEQRVGTAHLDRHASDGGAAVAFIGDAGHRTEQARQRRQDALSIDGDGKVRHCRHLFGAQ